MISQVLPSQQQVVELFERLAVCLGGRGDWRQVSLQVAGGSNYISEMFGWAGQGWENTALSQVRLLGLK